MADTPQEKRREDSNSKRGFFGFGSPDSPDGPSQTVSVSMEIMEQLQGNILKAMEDLHSKQVAHINARFEAFEARLLERMSHSSGPISLAGADGSFLGERPNAVGMDEPLSVAEKHASMGKDKVDREAKKQERFLEKFAHDEVFGKSKEEYENKAAKDKLRSKPDVDLSHTRSLQYVLQHYSFMLMPSSGMRLAWDGTSMILVIFIAMTLPYRVAYLMDCPSVTFASMDVVIDMFFIFDIFLNFRTAIFEDGELYTDAWYVARRYLRSWFWLDLTSSLPFDWFLEDGLIANGFRIKEVPCRLQPELDTNSSTFGNEVDDSITTQAFSLLRIFKVVKLLRLLRIARLFRYLARWEEQFIQFNSSTIRMFKLCVAVMLFSHWNGCFQFLIAALARDRGVFLPESWVSRAGIASKPPIEQWSWSFFHAASQLLAISVGVVEPVRTVELWLYLTSMLLGATMYAVFVASVTAFFADADPSAREYRAKLDMVNQYMRHAQLPAKIRDKIRTYYELRYPGGRAFDEPAIMSELSTPLTQQVRMHKCQAVLSALNILDTDRSLAFEFAGVLLRVVFVAGDYIIREDESSDGMYFVSSGTVEVLRWDEDQRENEVLTTLGAHSFFGEMALLNPAGKATASVRVITYFEGYMLEYKDYVQLVENHPSLHDYMQAAAKLRLRTRRDLAGERDADLTTLFAMLDPTKRKLLKLEREAAAKAGDKLSVPPVGKPGSTVNSVVACRRRSVTTASGITAMVSGASSSTTSSSSSPNKHPGETSLFA